MSFYSYILVFVYFINFSSSFQGSGGLFGFMARYQRLCFCRCGLNEEGLKDPATNYNGRLEGGALSTPHEFPWLAIIRFRSRSIPGTLLSDKHVITAAYPLIGIESKEILVTFGSHDHCKAEGNPILINSVETVLLHPGYVPSVRSNDIALLRLRHVVSFSRFISPVCMPGFTLGSQNYTPQVAWVAGWSDTSNSSCTLKVAHLPILYPKICMKEADLSYVTPDKGCLGPLGVKSVLCEDDAGAPVMTQSDFGAQFKLVGIVSSSFFNKTTSPLYTRISEHTTWIYENIRGDCQCF